MTITAASVELEPLKGIIQDSAHMFGLDPMTMMRIVSRVQRDLSIPVENNPAGDVASIRVRHLDKLGNGILAFMDKYEFSGLDLDAVADSDLTR